MKCSVLLCAALFSFSQWIVNFTVCLDARCLLSQPLPALTVPSCARCFYIDHLSLVSLLQHTKLLPLPSLILASILIVLFAAVRIQSVRVS